MPIRLRRLDLFIDHCTCVWCALFGLSINDQLNSAEFLALLGFGREALG
jgi:hypothetical protein